PGGPPPCRSPCCTAASAAGCAGGSAAPVDQDVGPGHRDAGPEDPDVNPENPDVGPGDATAVLPARHPGYAARSAAGLTGYERVLARAGLSPVAGIDEAGRGACAGPLVVAATAFEPRGLARLHGIADSKAL